MTKQSAVVIGATGLIGKALVHQLLASDKYQSVSTLARSPLNLDPTTLSSKQSEKLTQVLADFSNPETFQRDVQGDTLFCCIGTTIKMAGSESQMRTVDLDYPLIIANIAKANGVKNLVFVSSIGADSQANSFYLALKGEVEKKLIEIEFDKTLIVRPSVLVGQRKTFRLGERIATTLLYWLRFIPFARKYAPIKGSTVASAMIKLIEQQNNKLQIAENSTLHQVVR